MKLAAMNFVFATSNFACGNFYVGCFCLAVAGLSMFAAKVK